MLKILTDVALVVVLVAAGYALMTSKPKRRRTIARRIAVAAMAAVLLSEAYSRTGWMRWMNLGVVVFALCALLFDVVSDRRQKARGST